MRFGRFIAVVLLLGACRKETAPAALITAGMAPARRGTPVAIVEEVHAQDELRRIAALVRQAWERQPGASRAALLNQTIFETLGFAREVDDTDLSFVLLPSVLRGHRGSCVGLGALYVSLGALLNLPIEAVMVPGHLYVRIDEQGRKRNTELLRRGEEMPDDWYRNRYPIPGGSARAYGRALKLDELVGVIEYDVGQEHRRAGRLEEARQAYASAVSHFRDFAEAHASLGATLQLLGALPEARAAYAAARHAHPQLPGLDANLRLLDEEQKERPVTGASTAGGAVAGGRGRSNPICCLALSFPECVPPIASVTIDAMTTRAFHLKTVALASVLASAAATGCAVDGNQAGPGGTGGTPGGGGGNPGGAGSGGTTTGGGTGGSGGGMVTLPPAPGFAVIGYFPDWDGTPALLPFASLTHINYAFALPTAAGGLTPPESVGRLNQLVTLAHAKGVRVLIAIGGWNDGDDSGFETLAGNASARAAFVNAVAAFVTARNLDGADIDWEYPDGGQSAQNFALLMKELGDKLHGMGKVLSAAVIGEGGGSVLPEVFGYVDYLNIMAYDAGDPHSPYSYATKCLDYWLGRGLPKAKAILGLPFYGREPYTSYSDIVSKDVTAAQRDQVGSVSYNGIPTIKTKTTLAKQRGGGVMLWELSQDTQDATSLVRAIREVIPAGS